MPTIEHNESGHDYYARVGLLGRVGFGDRPAVLVVDEQKGMTDPQSAMGSRLDSVVEASVVVVNLANGKGIPVVYTAMAYKPDLSDAGLLGFKMPALKQLTMGSKWVELDDRLSYDATRDYLIVKKMQSGFFGTPLLSILKYHQIDTVVVLGCHTSGCVRASVKDGMDYGYRMIVPREGVGDRLREAHENNLFDIDGKLGDVVSLSETLEYLDGLVQHA
ncbi:isochorismatase family protein [Chloroflexota bacterium]